MSNVIEQNLTKVIDARLAKRKREDDEQQPPAPKKVTVGALASSLSSCLRPTVFRPSIFPPPPALSEARREEIRDHQKNVGMTSGTAQLLQKQLDYDSPQATSSNASLMPPPTAPAPSSSNKSDSSNKYLKPSTELVMSRSMMNRGTALYNQIAKMGEPHSKIFFKEVIEKYDQLLEIYWGGNNLCFNDLTTKSAPINHNPDVLKTVVKTVHELMIPATEAIWNAKGLRAMKKDKNYVHVPYNGTGYPKCCLVCDANMQLPFPCFKTIGHEKKARLKSWVHWVIEGLLVNFQQYNFTINSLTELFHITTARLEWFRQCAASAPLSTKRLRRVKLISVSC